MTNPSDTHWTTLKPPLRSKVSQDAFAKHARAVANVRPGEHADEVLAKRRAHFIAAVKASRRADRQALLAAGLVVSDLATQGWIIRVRSGHVHIKPPEPVPDKAAEKSRIRRQEMIKRNAQLRQPSVQRFLDSMERQRLHNGHYVSIYSLMRDGRELAEGLRLARSHELLLTVEEGSVGGFGSHVLELIARTDLMERGLKVRTMALPDVFVDHDTPAAQYAAAGLDARAIAGEALAALGRGAQARQLAGFRR